MFGAICIKADEFHLAAAVIDVNRERSGGSTKTFATSSSANGHWDLNRDGHES
jgi:hypothetical protein